MSVGLWGDRPWIAGQSFICLAFRDTETILTDEATGRMQCFLPNRLFAYSLGPPPALAGHEVLEVKPGCDSGWSLESLNPAPEPSVPMSNSGRLL